MNVSSNLTTFLETLPTEKLRGLYDNQWTCQAVFRSLPPLAKQYCLRMLLLERPLAKTILDGWLVSEKEHQETMEKLRRLQLMQVTADSAGKEEVSLHRVFRRHLQLSISGEGALHADVAEDILSYLPSETELLDFANERWEALLLYLGGASSQPLKKSAHLRGKGIALDRLLEHASLGDIQDSGRLAITAEGYRFLLMDQASQLWKLISHYIIAAEAEMGTDLGKLFSFLLELGFRPSNRPGDVASLDSILYNVATHMEQFGILKTFKVPSGDVSYVPTPLASCFCTVFTPSIATFRLGGSIVVETNFKVYGYTMSPLFRTVLDLFCRCDYTTPNFYVGSITRESMADALECGLSADLVVHYLHAHAHPSIQHRSPIVPHVSRLHPALYPMTFSVASRQNVSNQIRLWQKDIHRIQTDDGMLFEHFSSEDVFQRTVSFSKKQQLHLWDDGKSKIIVKLSGDARVSDGHLSICSYSYRDRTAEMVHQSQQIVKSVAHQCKR